MERAEQQQDCLGESRIKDHGKMNGAHTAMAERQRLDEHVTSLMRQIQEGEAKLLRVNQENETHQGTMRAIRQEKDDTIKQRKKVDEHLQSLNNEITDKREILVRLQGNLQYRKEERINEAIRRLEYQLVANNYKVSEEIKIVHEIDRLKRSKKSLCQYLALKEELDRTKDKLNTMRNERDASYRRVASFKSCEEDTKKNVRDNRACSDALRKEIDELHTKKRKAIADLKLASQPLLHLRELHQATHRRTPSFTKRTNAEDTNQMAAVTPTMRNGNDPSPACSRIGLHNVPHLVHASSSSTTLFHKRGFGKRSPTTPDPQGEQVRLCGTLVSYLLRLTNLTLTPATTPAPAAVTPVVEHKTASEDFFDGGDWITVLHRRGQCDETRNFHVQKGRALKKNKKEKKCQINKALCHTPEVLLQFDTLGLKPPSIVGDIPACLDKLTAKKESLAVEGLKTPSDVDVVMQCEATTTTAKANRVVSHSQPKTEDTHQGDVTDAALDLVSSKVEEISLTSPVLTKHTTDNSATICDKTTSNELRENDAGLSSCRSVLPLLPPPSPDVAVSLCGGEDKIPNVGLKLKFSRELDVELDSNNVSFPLSAAVACNGTFTNGGLESAAFLLGELE